MCFPHGRGFAAPHRPQQQEQVATNAMVTGIPAERARVLDASWSFAAHLYLDQLVPRFTPWLVDALQHLRRNRRQLPARAPVLLPCCGPGEPRRRTTSAWRRAGPQSRSSCCCFARIRGTCDGRAVCRAGHELPLVSRVLRRGHPVVGSDLAAGMVRLARVAIQAEAAGLLDDALGDPAPAPEVFSQRSGGVEQQRGKGLGNEALVQSLRRAVRLAWRQLAERDALGACGEGAAGAGDAAEQLDAPWAAGGHGGEAPGEMAPAVGQGGAGLVRGQAGTNPAHPAGLAGCCV